MVEFVEVRLKDLTLIPTFYLPENSLGKKLGLWLFGRLSSVSAFNIQRSCQ